MIYILSYGINPYRDISLQALKHLKNINCIYTVITHPQLDNFLKENGLIYKDISYLYKQENNWNDNYTRLSDFIISESKEHSPICYLTYGNPMILDKPVRLIIQKATLLNIKIEVLPAISFIDVILPYLNVSIGTNGIQIYRRDFRLMSQKHIN